MSRADAATWRYAMTREKDDNGDDFYTIREVYVGPDAKVSWTEQPIAACGYTWQECCDDLALMGRAVNRPILDLTLDPPRFVPFMALVDT